VGAWLSLKATLRGRCGHRSVHLLVRLVIGIVTVRVILPANKECVIVFIQPESAYWKNEHTKGLDGLNACGWW
jgi:hypothetical protein